MTATRTPSGDIVAIPKAPCHVSEPFLVREPDHVSEPFLVREPQDMSEPGFRSEPIQRSRRSRANQHQ